jgi:hypothetical protein
LSYVLLALTALPFIRPSNLYKPVPVPFDLQFSLGPFIITPTEVLTLIVAPIVTLVLVLAVRFTSWGLAMRAMSENADSARLSGVWIRRTSTLTWTVAGALSAFTAILNAPGQTSALTQALSPDLLLYALTAALIGAMVNLTVAFIAGIGMGVFLELLEWNIPSPAKQQLIIFVVVMVVLLVRVGALRKGARTGERSTWQHGAATTMRAGVDQLRRRVSVTGHLDHHCRRHPAALRALRRQQRPVQPDLHLRGHRPEPDHADRVGGPGLARAIRPRRRGRAGGRAPRDIAARCPS